MDKPTDEYAHDVYCVVSDQPLISILRIEKKKTLCHWN